MNLFRSFLTAGALVFALTAYPFESSAQTRLWGTYYGGGSAESAGKTIAGSDGSLFVIGTTNSPTGIATPNAFDPFLDEPRKAYLAKFDTNGKPVWATYYGDGLSTEGADLGLDDAGNIYVLGTVQCPSAGLATPNAYETTCQGQDDMFLAKFNSLGKRVWGTYFGGSGQDLGSALSVSTAGFVYLIGTTDSAQGLVPLPSTDAIYGGGRDTIIAKFGPAGNLAWARYFGGAGVDTGYDIACIATALEQCYVTGGTTSVAGIATLGAYDVALNGIYDAFLAKINGADGKISWSTYYGGEGSEQSLSVVASGTSVFVGGRTTSIDAMATLNAHDTTYNGIVDMFLAKFTADGQRQVGTYFGASEQDDLFDLSVDANKNLYVLGVSKYVWFENLTTPNAYDTSPNGPNDAVLAKFNPVLTRLWSTYYGGSEYEMDGGGGVAVGADGHVHLWGTTTSPEAIATPGAHKTVYSGNDAFLVEFSQ